MMGLGRHYELDITAQGEPDPSTGYLINIKDLDRAAHEYAIPFITRVCHDSPSTNPVDLLPQLVHELNAALQSTRGQLVSVRWRLSPTYSVEMPAASTSTAILRQQFDLAAAHRLHVPSLSEQDNRATFGKCNNPAGHGHNYRLEPAVAVPVPSAGHGFTLQTLEALVQRTIIEPFDHTHLNADTDAFATVGGVNPSVENIAKVFFDRLAPAIADASRGGAKLISMTVWETDRTSAVYEG